MGLGEGAVAPLCFSAPLLGSDFRLQTSDIRLQTSDLGCGAGQPTGVGDSDVRLGRSRSAPLPRSALPPPRLCTQERGIAQQDRVGGTGGLNQNLRAG